MSKTVEKKKAPSKSTAKKSTNSNVKKKPLPKEPPKIYSWD